MKRMNLVSILLSMLLCVFFINCSSTSRKQKIIKKNPGLVSYVVIPIPVGEYAISITSPSRHLSIWSANEGVKIGKGVWSPYASRWVKYCECCDSCYTNFEKAGLIKYNVISRHEEENIVRVNVELTRKGKKYLLDKELLDSDIAESLNAESCEIVILEKTELLRIEKITEKVFGEDWFMCDVIMQRNFTPFGELFGKDIDREYRRGGYIFDNDGCCIRQYN